jgi:hypothetical protein
MSLDTEFKYFYPKKLSQSSQKYGLDTGSGIRKKIIPDTGSWGPKINRIWDPESGSATLGKYFFQLKITHCSI